MKDKKDALALSMKDLGKALINEASKQVDAQKQAALLGRVSNLMERKQYLEILTMQCNDETALINKRLDAISKGKFTITSLMEIKFLDNELN